MKLRPGVPVVRLDDRTARVGLARPVLLTGLRADHAAALTQAEYPGPGADAGGAAWRSLVDTLAQAGHVAAPAESARHAAPTVVVRVLGDTSTAVHVAEACARAGAAVAWDAALNPSRRLSLIATLKRRIGAPTIASPEAYPHAVVGVSMGAAPAHLTRTLMYEDVPHLWITCDEAGATVGPWVLPGEGTCTRCVALWRVDEDPWWPQVSLQVEGRRPVLAPTVSAMAGALGASMVMSHVGAGERWAVNCQWRITATQPPLSQPVTPHPECGCGAAATISRISAP